MAAALGFNLLLVFPRTTSLFAPSHGPYYIGPYYDNMVPEAAQRGPQEHPSIDTEEDPRCHRFCTYSGIPSHLQGMFQPILNALARMQNGRDCSAV